MPNGTLRVLAKGTAQVPNYEAQAGGRNARVSHSTLPIGPQFDDVDQPGRKLRHAVFVKHVGRVLTVPDRAEYRRHLRDRDLWPADQETAAACGVPFDPTFGGEHTAEALEGHRKGLLELVGDNKDLTGWLAPHLAAILPEQAAPPPPPPAAPAPDVQPVTATEKV